ncbi:MAG: hypothetical protein J5367_07640 [Lachnospiraceae bacterium]|nr:hypothetical protein [Lachnospiraceae bacterium]
MSYKNRISAKVLFLICAIIGAVCFLGIYGVRVLDFTNTGWLFDNDHDLRQHYIAWCHFRSNPWHFPIGLIDTLSYPDSMSIIYTDSIPMFAVIFKLFAPYLPVTFQYFGLFGLISFALMGGFAALLLRRFVDSDSCCIIGSVFYVISAPVIQRMFFHTALGAQFIVIAAMVLWVYNDIIGSNVRRTLYWGLIGFVCVGIHSYFLPMAGMMLAAVVFSELVKQKGYVRAVAPFLSFCAAGLINLYILGGFYGGTSAEGYGLGTFGSNLNTFINPWEIGQILPRLPLQNDFQYEGMAYLGAGILMLFVIVAAGMVIRRVRHVPEEAFHSKNLYGRLAIAIVAVSFLAAVFPNISYNDIKIVWLPLPSFIARPMSVFRSNGRLIWPAMYILMTAAISFTAYTFRRTRVGTIALAGALVLQIADMSNAFAGRYELYMRDHAIRTVWDEGEPADFVHGEKEFIFLYTDNDITMQTAYYGYLHGMRQNNYYFARDIEGKISATIDLYYAELDKGNIRDGAVYILKRKDYNKNRDYYDALDADMLESFDHVMFKAGR